MSQSIFFLFSHIMQDSFFTNHTAEQQSDVVFSRLTRLTRLFPQMIVFLRPFLELVFSSSVLVSR